MNKFTIQWRQDGELMNTDIGATDLEEAKQKVVKSQGIKYSQILGEGAWR